MLKDISNSIDTENQGSIESEETNDIKGIFLNMLISIALAIIFTCFINITIISGNSMYPTLNNKQILVMEKVTKILNNLDRGDIISFKAYKDIDKNIFYIKRIIGIPGDAVEIKNGQVFVNNSLLAEEYLDDGVLTETPDNKPLKVTLKDDEYFVLGDNRSSSVDSRFEQVGIVKKEQIISKKLFSIFPGEK